MIGAIWRFFRDEVAPRWSSILWKSELWIAALLGIAAGLFGDGIPLGHAKVGDVISSVLTYSSIAFGFCLSGLTIVLAMPDGEFVRRLATSRLPNQERDAYSDLLFVFSWTAVAHWIDVAGAIVLLVFCGFDELIFPPCKVSSKFFCLLGFHFTISGCAGAERRITVAIATFSIAYAVFQFLITLITLAQVGRVYVRHLSKTSAN